MDWTCDFCKRTFRQYSALWDDDGAREAGIYDGKEHGAKWEIVVFDSGQRHPKTGATTWTSCLDCLTPLIDAGAVVPPDAVRPVWRVKA